MLVFGEPPGGAVVPLLIECGDQHSRSRFDAEVEITFGMQHMSRARVGEGGAGATEQLERPGYRNGNGRIRLRRTGFWKTLDAAAAAEVPVSEMGIRYSGPEIIN